MSLIIVPAKEETMITRNNRLSSNSISEGVFAFYLEVPVSEIKEAIKINNETNEKGFYYR